MLALPDGACLIKRLERRGGNGRRHTDSELLGTSAAMAAFLDRLGQGVVLVEDDGRVRFANRMARRLSAEGDALRIRSGRLSGVTVSDAPLLAKAIKVASAGGLEHALRLRRASGKRPLLVLIIPGLSLPGEHGSGAGCALLLVTDPAVVSLPPKERLIQAYGFTATESTLARLLLQGSDLGEAAHAMNVGMATARSHLRGLLTKTGTHRQADLVRVLLQEMGPIP